MNSIDKKCRHDVLIKNGEITSTTGVSYNVGECMNCGTKNLIIPSKYKRNEEIEKIYGINSEVYSKVKREKKEN
jgi:hypothetical protein